MRWRRGSYSGISKKGSGLEGSGDVGPGALTFRFLASAFVYALGLEHHSVQSLRVRLLKTDLPDIAHHPSFFLSLVIFHAFEGQATRYHRRKHQNTKHADDAPMRIFCPGKSVQSQRVGLPDAPTIHSSTPLSSCQLLDLRSTSHNLPQTPTHRLRRSQHAYLGSESGERIGGMQVLAIAYTDCVILFFLLALLGSYDLATHGHGHTTCFFGQLFQIRHVVLRSSIVLSV